MFHFMEQNQEETGTKDIQINQKQEACGGESFT